ncbi:hypothetical protein EVAR_84268_1 [Eumeta japonica]|uniref:Uncharacterized protein n=1 Tax=Eumeta variegata TaxID=151549 RepID=A0A4C1WUR2_EUMVA|nr:hypothetical protein EVAR_84268_1 [Eumeta japonica]
MCESPSIQFTRTRSPSAPRVQLLKIDPIVTSSDFTHRPRVEDNVRLRRSELPANDEMRGYYNFRPFLLLPRFPVLRHCDAFITNFTAAECTVRVTRYSAKTVTDPKQVFQRSRCAPQTSRVKNERSRVMRPTYTLPIITLKIYQPMFLVIN